jgi:hypothetical protein
MKANAYLTDFQALVERLAKDFRENALFKKLDTGRLEMADYHRILLTIFHQTYSGPLTFAQAAVNCPRDHFDIQAYLLHHAEEEKDHWLWIIEDLKATGYQGEDPRTELPPSSCLRYITLNHFVADKYPVARLGIAAVLETIGAKFGRNSFMKIKEVLGLGAHQVKFFFGHGDTDVAHTADIFKLLAKANLSDEDWKNIFYFAKEGAALYRGMYEEAAGIGR